jgi:hypothetical protein
MNWKRLPGRLFVFTLTAALLVAAPMAAFGCTAGLSVAPADGAPALPPTGAAPGTSLVVTGTDFPEGRVLLHWGTSDGPVMGEAMADDRGEFTVEVVVPTAVTGKQRVIAQHTDAGDTGMPAVAWADLLAPVAANSTLDGAATSGTSSDDGSSTAVAVGLVVLAIAGAATARRYARRPGSDLRGDLADPSELDQELEQLLAFAEPREPADV